MIGVYDGKIYIAHVEEGKVDISTYDEKKCTAMFVKEWKFYTRQVVIDDPKLENLYDIHFFVEYQGEIWNVDGGRPTGLSASLENYEVVIMSPQDAIDDTWTQIDKGYSAKIISLLDCSECIIKKIYFKKDSICLDEKTTETNQVDAQTLRDQMLSMKNI